MLLPGILVVTNPRSRQNRRDPGLSARLAAVVGESGRVEAPADPVALAEVARRAWEEGVEVLAINGGDGSAHVVLTAFLTARPGAPLPPVALLCGGTMNTVARGVGVRGGTEALLRRLVEATRAGRPVAATERNLLCVAGQAPQYGFLFGNGLISNFLEVYYEGEDPSPTKAAVILARGVASAFVNGALIRRLMRPVEVEVEVGGSVLAERRFLAVTAGTVDDIGLGFRPFFEALTTPGSLHALAIACSPFALVLQLPRVRLARPTTHPRITSLVGQGFCLRGEGPLGFMVDGDFHLGPPSLVVSVGPRVSLLLP